MKLLVFVVRCEDLFRRLGCKLAPVLNGSTQLRLWQQMNEEKDYSCMNQN